MYSSSFRCLYDDDFVLFGFSWSSFLNLYIDVICLQCLQIRIPAAQCSHRRICPRSGWYTRLPVAYSTAAMSIMIQTMKIKRGASLQMLCVISLIYTQPGFVLEKSGTKHGTAFVLRFKENETQPSAVFTMDSRVQFYQRNKHRHCLFFPKGAFRDHLAL